MPNPKVVSREEWLDRRKALLAKEKAFSRSRDELNRQRRELPWVRIEKSYVFEGPDGKESLADLFGARSQLIVFNYDFHVSSTAEERAKGRMAYNYGELEFSGEELPGASAFCKDAQGGIFHTYSAYARGLDLMIGTYNWLDIAPKGRDEEGLKHSMSWVRHHDKYGEN